MAEAKRPKKVKVGHHTLRIKYLPHEKWPAHNQDAMGVCYNNQSLITIRTSDEDTVQNGRTYSEAELKQTLLHEIMHACFHVTNLHFTIGQDGDREELTCATLSPTLLAVLRDNPKVLLYLLT